MGKLVGVLHRLGFDEVYDTSYGADLTVIEESKEFIERFTAGEKLPLFIILLSGMGQTLRDQISGTGRKLIDLQISAADVRSCSAGVL